MSNLRSGHPNVTTANNNDLETHSSELAHRFTGPMLEKVHHNPVELYVTAEGERIICPIDDVNTNTKPFVCVQKESESSSTFKETKTKLIRKKNKFHKQKSRMQERAYQKSDKIKTQLSSYTPKQELVQKCAWVQTDQPLNTGLEKELNLSLVNKKLTRSETFLDKFMPENLQILTSFLMMVILIFWLTSVIVDFDVSADFWKISTSYLRSFKLNNYYKKSQTNAEKYFEYIKKFFV